MGKQSDIFLQGEGQAWLDRNLPQLPVKDDPVIPAMLRAGIRPRNVLEVGCANGWRLEEMRKIFGCRIRGIDPSIKISGFVNGGFLEKGTADTIHSLDRNFDAVIYGFCLYLCDPEDYLRIAAEGDRVLADGGYIVIYDFHPDLPHSRIYKHHDGVLTRKMNFSRLWLGHPAYTHVLTQPCDEGVSVIILRKDSHNAFPLASE